MNDYFIALLMDAVVSVSVSVSAETESFSRFQYWFWPKRKKAVSASFGFGRNEKKPFGRTLRMSYLTENPGHRDPDLLIGIVHNLPIT